MERRHPYQLALDRARQDLSRLDPWAVASRSGGEVLREAEGQAIALSYWGREVRAAWPGGEVTPATGAALPVPVQLIVLHYLVTADGAPLADRWLTFRELPDGRVYDAAFRKRACLPLVRVYGQRPGAFLAAGQRLGGQRLVYGDASFMWQVLPRVRVAVILHGSDEEFPAEASMLFDASMRHYLPIEDVAVLGGIVAGELIRARPPEGG